MVSPRRAQNIAVVGDIESLDPVWVPLWVAQCLAPSFQVPNVQASVYVWYFIPRVCVVRKWVRKIMGKSRGGGTCAVKDSPSLPVTKYH